MKKFITQAGDMFEWRQLKKLERSFELYKQTEVFGTLKFRSQWGTLAFSEDPVQKWSFKRIGFLNPQVTIRMINADSDYAIFQPKLFSGGTLFPPDGRLVGWQPLNFWRTKWQFTDRRGDAILILSQTLQSHNDPKLSDILKIQATVTMETSHITNLEFSLLVNLGFYLLVLQSMDAAVTTAGAA